MIESLQADVSQKLTAEDPNRLLDGDDRRARARSLVNAAVAQWVILYAQGNTPLSSDQERAISDAVFNAMFRGGRLQSLLDEEGVEDIMVDGLKAHIEYYDRPRRTIDRIADSHDELTAWVNRMAGLSGHGERSLTQATPSIGFRMPDGSRVTSSLLTTRPSVAIRKHRIRDHGLDQLLEMGSINPILRAFLIGCVMAKLNILVVGDMGAGKTSLLRALGREIPAEERLVTLESDRELYLDEPGPPDKPGPLTFAFEARQSNGEVRAGERTGEITISDMFDTALRYNATRVMVGEVRSKEILSMLDTMSAGGKSSMCTLHVRRPHAIISRLVQLCTNAGMQTEAAHHLIASSVDVVVYLTYLDETALGGRRHRFVSHVLEIHDVVGEGGRPSITEIFAPQGTERRAVYRNMPSFVDELELTGNFYRHWFTHEPAAWGAPLELVRR
ncbi:CpaF/VirB11 family protein [Streptomyces sp. H27-H1]|uniref:CpaF family protein n=1 Tax=Streptomyces sp. H27-H1 TaxID=2996461 RepID=UPI00226D6809|nr:CpaF/VirB11 family protein [Streptomyces sp. H27-H1]MCY0931644.1 CpaF/VirB11 family protein [Streptomyces sp. H27-H1]